MNNTKDDGGFAFPCENDSNKYYNWINKGMTLRDYFAAAALQGLLANEGQNDFESQYGIRAYAIADAMLQARKEGV